MSNNCSNHELEMAWRWITSTNMSVFLTGKAGTGKTTFLRRLAEESPKRMVVLAPTGVAAINAGGQTLHSFFQLPFGPFLPGSKSKTKEDARFRMTDQKKRLIRSLNLLVIDEVSMVRADLLDLVDDTLRKLRDRSRPFGGLQLLLIGDLMQLSPVARRDEWKLLEPYYSTPYFFSSRALARVPYVTVELRQIYRQHDAAFVDLLGRVRRGCLDADTLRSLNSRYLPGFTQPPGGWIRLTSHNAMANAYNLRMMSLLKGKPLTFRAVVKGDFPEGSFPMEAEVELKPGAQVMFVKNDPEKRYYNGKLGIIDSLEGDNEVIVKCHDDAAGTQYIKVSPLTWDNTRYTLNETTREIEENVAGTFTQMPLRPAWAITVHKSQGLTFDHAVLDINESFAHGQAYVALSRCRSLEGLVLASPLDLRSVITDRTVDDYVDRQSRLADECERHIGEYEREYLLGLLADLFDTTALSNDTRQMARTVAEHLPPVCHHIEQKLSDMAAEVDAGLADVARRFAVQCRAALEASAEPQPGTLPDALAQRVADGCRYFAAQLKAVYQPVTDGPMLNIAIKNAKTAEVFNAEKTRLIRQIAFKLTLFKQFAGKQPFTTTAYLSARAKALLDATAPASSASRTRTRRNPRRPTS